MAEEKIYTIPLRKEWLKTPRHKRAKKAAKSIKKFLIRHLKIRDKNSDKIKIDPLVNEAIWIRGIKKPPHKITIKVIKREDNFIIKLVSLPAKFKEEDKKLKKKQKKIEESEKVKEKKKKEEAAKKTEEEKEEKKKTEEERIEEEKKKEKDKLLKKVIPVEKTQKFVKPTKMHGAEHRVALEK